MGLPDGAKKMIIASKLEQVRLAISEFCSGVKTWYHLVSLTVMRNEDASRWGPLTRDVCFAFQDGPEDYNCKQTSMIDLFRPYQS